MDLKRKTSLRPIDTSLKGSNKSKESLLDKIHIQIEARKIIRKAMKKVLRMRIVPIKKVYMKKRKL